MKITIDDEALWYNPEVVMMIRRDPDAPGHALVFLSERAGTLDCLRARESVETLRERWEDAMSVEIEWLETPSRLGRLATELFLERAAHREKSALVITYTYRIPDNGRE
jgi:hypothetical protein